jgi:hypothetical protein
MRRVKFRKNEQRKFLKDVLIKLNCPSLKELNYRGFDLPYSTLKNYYSEARLMPESLFNDLCYVIKIDPLSLRIEYLDSNWGQIKGGKSKK